MTHLHIPDGVIPWPWLLAGFALTGLLLLLAGRGLAPEQAAARVPRAAVISALMILGMSIPLGFIPFHMNLTVLAGMLLGPRLGILAGVAVNVILGLMGHGGLTVVGLNSLITSAEVALGALLFHALRRRLGTAPGAAAATAATLVLSFALIVGAAGLAGADLGVLRDTDDLAAPGAPGEGAGGLLPFVATVSPIFTAGVAIEAAVAAAVAGYLQKVRPAFLEG